MTPERWQRVDEIFQAAIELDPAGRAAFLDTSCAGDQELRSEVESLISCDQQGLSFVDEPAFNVAAGLLATREPELAEGQSLGHYEIVGLLGRGGMGEVYLAKDKLLNRRIALKLLPADYTRNKDRLRRFQQEAQAASALNHPNILTIYELGQVNGQQFIATEFVEGETLRQRLKCAPLTQSETLDIAIQMASALSAAHRAGIVHRDIKPENIMAQGLQVDQRSDIFSLGVVLYELLAGRAPFKGETAHELIAAILKEEPPRLIDVPDEMQRLIAKALSKKKKERYQTIEDLLVDLRSLKEEIAIGARAQISKRHRFVILVTLVFMMAAVGVALYLQVRTSGGPLDSIAVLPFVNQNQDANMDYRSDGLTESIINSLTQLPNLKVIARSSVFHYKGREANPLAAGKELGVRAVLTGRVIQHGDELTVSAELIDVRESKQMWGEQYERKVSDLLAVQREIAKEISTSLRLKLSRADESRVTKHYTESPEAYQLYLKGRFYWNKRTGEALKRSIEYFNKALEKDPGYALAYAGLADAYVLLPLYGAGTPLESAPKAKVAATRALELARRSPKLTRR